MAGVIVPGAKQKDGALETVMKGLAIASSVYGIKADMAKTDAYAEEAKQKQADREQAKIEKNSFGPKEQVELLSKNKEVPEGTPGAIPATFLLPNGAKQTYLIPKEERIAGSWQDTVGPDGKQKRVYVENKIGSQLPVYTKPEDEAKNNDPYSHLTEPKKREINKITDMVATNKSVANLLEAELETFRKAKSEDEKIRAGEGMLKLINSALGPDAVGTDEAKRIGAALQYQVFNLRGAGPAFGRDLPGFDVQIQNKINSLRVGAKKNEQQIANIAGFGAPTFAADVNLNDLPKGGPGTAIANPKGGQKKAGAGSTVKIDGKSFMVADDGDTLIPLGNK